jgi:N-sulfoglucosamine sulfohydrolase
VGLLLDELEKSGRAKQTMVIYVSDNGMPFPRAKTTLYDAGVHLPMLVHVPGRKQGIVSEAMVSYIDVAPTVLEFAGVEPPKPMQGRSFLQVIEQPDARGWDEVYGSHIFHEITNYYPMRSIRTRQWKLIWNVAHELTFPLAGDIARSPTWQALRDAEAGRDAELRKVLLHRPEFELYDVQSDPLELKNLSDDPAHETTLERLRERLTKRLRQTGDPFAPRPPAADRG